MPSNIVAQAGQTLCDLAIDAGFIDCQPIRDLADNAGKAFLNRQLQEGDIVVIPDLAQETLDKANESEHVFEKKNSPPVLIRFTHGSPDKPFREDATLNVLNISNYPTDKAGKNLKSKLPTATKFDQLGHDDIDTFKLEIVDPSGPATVEATLEALKPIFKTDGTIDHFEPFDGADHDKRSLKVNAELVKSKVCYRSPYIRLVVDERDQAAVPRQTLLIADTTDGKAGDADKIEILGQKVRASYARTLCPAPTKCTSVAELQVGEDIKKIKVIAHILKDPADGKALSTDEQVRRTLLMYMRQIYAQANLTVSIIAAARDIVAPANMLVVDNEEGRDAAGGGKIDVRIRIDAAFDQTVSVVTVKDDNCEATAKAIQAAIQAVLPPGITARVFPNPALMGKTKGSADVVVGEPLKNDIRVTILASGDAKQQVRAAAITTAAFVAISPTARGIGRHVGAINNRVLLNNYDTGRDRIDVFVVGEILGASGGGLFGLAFPPWQKYSGKYGHGAARDEVANSFLVNNTTLHVQGQPENFYSTIPHEIGHVLMDAVHTPEARPTELMGPGSPVGQDERVVNGCKRITDGDKIQFDDKIKDVPVEMIRNNNGDVFE